MTDGCFKGLRRATAGIFTAMGMMNDGVIGNRGNLGNVF
jgi:hypothetical protein